MDASVGLASCLLHGMLAAARDVCLCTTFSVFVYRVRALSPAKPIWTAKKHHIQCCHSWVFSARSGFFRCRLGFWVFLSVIWVFSFITYQNFFPCRKLNKKLSYCRENSAVAVQFIVDSVQGHPRSLISILIESAYRVYDFLIVINSNLAPSLHRFGVRTTYWLKIDFRDPPLIKPLR